MFDFNILITMHIHGSMRDSIQPSRGIVERGGEVLVALVLHLLLGAVTGNFGNLPDYGVDRCAGRVKPGPGPLYF